jgi:hypothetical protein
VSSARRAAYGRHLLRKQLHLANPLGWLEAQLDDERTKIHTKPLRRFDPASLSRIPQSRFGAG